MSFYNWTDNLASICSSQMLNLKLKLLNIIYIFPLLQSQFLVQGRILDPNLNHSSFLDLEFYSKIQLDLLLVEVASLVLLIMFNLHVNCFDRLTQNPIIAQ